MESPFLLQARAAIAGEGLKAKNFCRFTKWLLSTQNKLRTAINKSSTINTTTVASNKNKRSCSPARNGSKSLQQRRIHNEIFGWTSDAWDEMSELSAPASSTTITLPLSPTRTTPQTEFVSREELLVRYEDYTVRRLENAFMQNTIHGNTTRGRRTDLKEGGWGFRPLLSSKILGLDRHNVALVCLFPDRTT